MPLLIVKSPQTLKEMLGKEIGVSEWFRITQDRIGQFAEAVEDRQWIHLDEKRASNESPYGATIAHGFLTLSLIGHFVSQAIEFHGGVRLALNYGLNRVRFPAAVRSGCRIRGRVFLADFRELPDSWETTYRVTVESEGSEKPVCVAEWIVRYYS
ncbi:MAG TPA: MaoC family dehydratase [Verrucomicrobiae bacterium]|nr:MaoC family dehydratase [Verrucomicrobiae bacterium]